MNIDNTHELQRVFAKIISESEGFNTDDNSQHSNVCEGSYMPCNYGQYSTKDEMIRILNGTQKITSPSWNDYPYTDDGKTYIYKSGGGSPFYPITNIEKKDNQIIFSVSEKDCIDWEKYEDNIEGKDKRDKDEEKNSNNSSLISNEQVLKQCKGIDEHTELLASIHNKLYPIKRMDVLIFNKHETIVLHANWMDIDEIRDMKAKAEKAKAEKENNDKKKDQEIQQLIRWVTKKFGKTGDEARKFATNIYNKKHGLSKQKTRWTDQYPRKYKMSDGNTIIYVNPDDVYDAKKDGFHIVSEDGKEGHSSASNSNYIQKFHDNDFNYALEKIDLHDTREVLIKLCRVIIDILQWGDCPKLLKKLREEFGKNGDSVDRIILDALEKELNDEKTKLHKYRIDWHNEDPKHTSHPDKIDVKKMRKPNLPNE